MDPASTSEREMAAAELTDNADSVSGDSVMPDDVLEAEVSDVDAAVTPPEDSDPGSDASSDSFSSARHTASQLLDHMQVDTTDPTNVMIIIGAVLVLGVGGAWWWLGDEDELPVEAVPITRPTATTNFERLPAVVSPVTEEAEEPPQSNLDALLDRARMATDAGLYTEPGGVSALDYYLAALDEDPLHPEAIAGVDTILVSVFDDARTAINNGRTDDAIATISWVKEFRPNNANIIELEAMLVEAQSARVQQVTQMISRGDFAAAESRLETLAQDRYANTAAIADAGEQLAAAQAAAREKARTDARQEQQLARQERIQGVISEYKESVAAGQLLNPEDNSARFHLQRLAAIDSNNPEIQSGHAAIVAGLIVRANTEAAQANYEAAENWLVEAEKIGVGVEKIAEVRQSIAQRQVDEQTDRVIPATELTLVRYVPPDYPSLAIRREIEGYVDVIFTVTTSGETADVEIVSGEKQNYFEKSTVEAVEQWRFEPRLFNGQAVNQRVSFRLDFKLHD